MCVKCLIYLHKTHKVTFIEYSRIITFICQKRGGGVAPTISALTQNSSYITKKSGPRPIIPHIPRQFYISTPHTTQQLGACQLQRWAWGCVKCLIYLHKHPKSHSCHRILQNYIIHMPKKCSDPKFIIYNKKSGPRPIIPHILYSYLG